MGVVLQTPLDGIPPLRKPRRRRRGRAPVALPPGPDPGQEDGQGPHLLAGDGRLHEHQRDADPPRPLELREVRQARRRLLDRRSARRDPQDPAHPGPAQHRACRGRTARTGDRGLSDLRRARDHDRRRLRRRRHKGRASDRRRGGEPATVASRRSSTTRTSSSVCSRFLRMPPSRWPTISSRRGCGSSSTTPKRCSTCPQR